MFDIQKELKKLPDKPGVYIMKDQIGTVIYVGKAVVLKNRVRQYFQASSNHSPKVTVMVTHIAEFEYIVTDTELEALILECTLIKEHRPKFNVLLKDDKNYPYIKVSMQEEYPRVLMTRRLDKDGAKYFGPYSNVGAVKETIELIKRLFPIKACSKVFPRDIGKMRPCLNFHIHQCLGPCQGNVSKDEYRALMKDICLFLNGRMEEVVKRLENMMKEASLKLEFEKAASYRDKIASLKHIAQKQKMVSTGMEDQDFIAVEGDDTDSVVQIFMIRDGKLTGKEHFILEGTVGLGEAEILLPFIKQYYNASTFVPAEVIVSREIEELEILEDWLSTKRGTKVSIKEPKRGEKLDLIKMVQRNAKIAFLNFQERGYKNTGNEEAGIKLLTEVLGLQEMPSRIEAYDISNTGITDVVGSMVVFENGKPANHQYRRFKIKSIDDKPDDYKCMQEVIFRRFKHAEKERELLLETGKDIQEGKFSTLPNIILLDGGIGHIHSVKLVLKELGINIPVFGMVKDNRHRTRGIMREEGEIDLSKDLILLRFVTWIQDEVHRFAIEYNRKLGSKRYQKSVLDEIDGIGPKRKKALIKHFGSVSRIRTASVEEILKVEGFSKELSEKVVNYLRRE